MLQSCLNTKQEYSPLRQAGERAKVIYANVKQEGFRLMADAYIIDAVRTPRGIGKPGKGALSHLHPQHLAATVLKALKDRNDINTASRAAISGGWRRWTRAMTSRRAA
jgi:hypothetical protein